MKRIAREYPSHGNFHENQIFFYLCDIPHVLLPHHGQRHLPFVRDLFERGKHRARRFFIQACHSLYRMFSALCLRNQHHESFWRDLFDCETHLRDKTNNEAPQIACSRSDIV
jgi:hypothetical protein